jgi:hypothetical protein
VAVVCTVGAGTGANHSWELIVSNQSSTRYYANSRYASPVVNSYLSNISEVVSVDDFSTEGLETVMITGLNFGPVTGSSNGSSYVAPLSVYSIWSDEYTFTHSDCVVTIANTEMKCLTGIGVGKDLQWVVEVDRQTNSLAATSYGAPVVKSVSLYENWLCGDDEDDGSFANCTRRNSDAFTVATKGGDFVVLEGKNFGGRQIFLQYVSFGPTGTEYVLVDSSSGQRDCNITVPHTAIRCLVPPGSGKMHVWKVVVAGISSGVVIDDGPYLNYTAPNISHVVPSAVGITSGGYEVTLVGSNFGPEGEMAVYFWNTLLDTADTTYIKDGKLTFTAPVGQGGGHGITVVQESSSCIDDCAQVSNTANFTYGAPFIDRVVVQSVSTNGKLLRLLLYGPESSVAYLDGGSYGAAQSFTWTDDDGSSTAFENVVYVKRHKNSSITDQSTSECQVLSTYDGSYGHDLIDCVTTATNGSLVVYAGNVASNVVSFSGISPSVSSLTVGYASDGASRPTTGGFTLTITGGHFGDTASQLAVLLYLPEYNSDGDAYMDHVECLDLELVYVGTDDDGDADESIIECTAPPGQGENVNVIVRRGGAAGPTSDYTPGDSCEPCFSYDAPSFSSWLASFEPPSSASSALSLPIVAATDGYVNATLYGENLGIAAANIEIWIGDYDSSSLVDINGRSHVHVSFLLPRGCGTDYTVTVAVANQETTVELDYASPTIGSVSIEGGSATTLRTVGGESLTITGSNFCAPSGSGTSIVPSLRDVVLDGPDDISSTGVVRMANARTGSDTPVRDVIVTYWNHSRIEAVSLAGEGTGMSISVTSGDQEDLYLDALSYTAPSLEWLSPESSYTSGTSDGSPEGERIVMRIAGQNFGTTNATRSVNVSTGARIRSTDLAGVDDDDQSSTYPGRWIGANHSLIEVYIPSGQSSSVAVSVEVEGQSSSQDLTFSYLPPAVKKVDPLYSSTEGCTSYESLSSYVSRLSEDASATRNCDVKEYITITGVSFGTKDLAIHFGALTCYIKGTFAAGASCDDDDDDTCWDCLDCDSGDCSIDHDELIIRAPTGTGTDLRVSVVVSGQSSSRFTNSTRQNPPSMADVLNFSFTPPSVDSVNPGSYGQNYGYFNARGDDLAFYGKNFGGTTSSVEITIGGVACEDATWNGAAVDVATGLPTLSCTIPEMVVGTFNATVFAAKQLTQLKVRTISSNSLLQSVCEQEQEVDGSYTTYYGVAAYEEPCLVCPPGALCEVEERDEDPVSSSGFWRVYYDVDSSSASEYCADERRSPYRDYCPYVPLCSGHNM